MSTYPFSVVVRGVTQVGGEHTIMDQTPDAFAAALASDDTDRVNRAINEVEDLDLEERAALFEDCFE